MAEIFKVQIRREPDAKAGLLRLDRGIEIAPGAAAKNTPAKTGSSSWFGGAGRLLTPALLTAYGDHFLVPRPAANATKDTSEDDFEKLYADLHNAFTARDGMRLDAVAHEYLTRHAVSELETLDPVARGAYTFFDAHRNGATVDALNSLATRFSREHISAHFTATPALMSRLKGQALAALVQRTLSTQPIDTIHMMRSLAAYQLLGAAKLADVPERRGLPNRLIGEIIAVDIFLPKWAFAVEVCRWAHNAREKPALLSPLRRQLDAIAQFEAGGAKVQSGNGCDCSGDLAAPCAPPDPCCADVNYYVAETLILRDQTIGYQPSDLAFIQNVQAFEERSLQTTFNRTIEEYSETETTVTRTDEHDMEVNEKFSLQKTISDQLKASLDVTAKYDGGTYSIDTKADLSKEVAQTEAREHVRETVSKAITKLQSEERSLTTRRVTTSATEVNLHKFANNTEFHSVGKYFYATKTVEGQVFSNGQHVTVDLRIPDPAALHEHLEHLKMMRGFKPTLVPMVVTPRDISVDDYDKYLKDYSIAALPAPPVAPAAFTANFGFSASPNKKGSGQDWGVQLPAHPGFFIEEFWFADVSTSQHTGSMAYQIEVYLGSDEVFRRYDKNNSLLGPPSSRDAATGLHITGTPTIELITQNVHNVSGTIAVKWSPLPVDLLPWQIEVCDIINKAHRDQVEAAEFAEYKQKYDEGRVERSPLSKKLILLAELKRAAIYMMCQNFERGGVMNMNAQPCGYPEINRPAAARECWDWYFWERAFDWNLMSFIFYDYFWNPMCSWPDKFDPGDPDYMFNSFLASGMVRVTVPASRGMDADVVNYLETGEKWNGSKQLAYNSGDPRFISVVQEIMWSHDCYQNDREGMVTGILDGTGSRTNEILLTGTDRYWDPLINPPVGVLNYPAIDDDVGRQIFIDGIAYRIQGIALDPASPPYSTSGPPLMQWIVALERVFEGAASVDPNGAVFPHYAHAVGDKFIGAPFRWDEPTQLVWLGDGQNKCLPTYPIVC